MINECSQSFDLMEGTVRRGPWRLFWWPPKYIGDIIDMWVSIQKRGAQVHQWKMLTLLLFMTSIIIWVKHQTNRLLNKKWPVYNMVCTVHMTLWTLVLFRWLEYLCKWQVTLQCKWDWPLTTIRIVSVKMSEHYA